MKDNVKSFVASRQLLAAKFGIADIWMVEMESLRKPLKCGNVKAVMVDSQQEEMKMESPKTSIDDTKGELDSGWGDLASDEGVSSVKSEEMPSGDLDISAINPFVIASASAKKADDAKASEAPKPSKDAEVSIDDMWSLEGESVLETASPSAEAEKSETPEKSDKSESSESSALLESTETSEKSKSSEESSAVSSGIVSLEEQMASIENETLDGEPAASSADEDVDARPIPPNRDDLVLAEDDPGMEFEGMEEPEMSEERKKRRMPTNPSLSMMDDEEPKRSKTGLIVVLVILVLLCLGAVAYFFVIAPKLKEAASKVADQLTIVVEEQAEPVQRMAPLAKVQGTLNIPDKDAKIFINGVEVPYNESNSYNFIAGRANNVIVYSKTGLPFIKFFPQEYDFSESVDAVFSDDSLYPKARVSFRFEDFHDENATIYFDGEQVENWKEPLDQVLLGFPHHVVVEKEGKGKHLHLYWPMSELREGNTVVIPKLLDDEGQKTITELILSKADGMARVNIKYGDDSTEGAGELKVMRGEQLYYHLSLKKRVNADFAVETEPYASVKVQPGLLTQAVGTVDVSFKQPPKHKKEVNICFRRVGEVICPDMHSKASEIPSGKDWEVIAFYKDADGSRSMIRGNFTQELKANKIYDFNITMSKAGVFSLAIEGGNPKKRETAGKESDD